MPAPSPIAANLARLRAASGFTQNQLAGAAGLSRLALGRIERGLVTPRAATLERLALALGVPLEALVSPARRLGRVRFRADRIIQGREAILAEVADWLDGYVELERTLRDTIACDLLPASPARRVKRRALDPVKQANRVRGALGIDDEPVRDISGLLESHGIKVLRLVRTTDTFFGLSVGAGDGGPAVAVNTWERISVERWIFSAAHELGHLVLHSAGDAFDTDGSGERPDEEREADRFASHLLMPEATFAREWDAAAGHALLDRVLKVKRIFRVSYKTVLHRLVESGRAEGTVWRGFQLQHKRRYGSTLRKVDEPESMSECDFGWNRADEPERLSPSDFVEDRLHRLVRRAFEQGLISLGRAAELLRIEREDVRQLARDWLD